MVEVFELEPYEALYLHRKRAKLTQRKVAKQLEVSINTYCDIELGLKPYPKWATLIFDTSISNLEKCILLRRRKSWFQQRLATEIGTSRNWVNRMEAGKENPHLLFTYWGI